MAANALKPQYIPSRSTPGKLAGVDPEQLLDRIADGEWPARLAKEYDVSRPAMYYKLKDHPEYQMCREIGMHGLLDDGLQAVAAAPDLNSARMEEVKLRRLEWRAEREFPHRWGQKQQVLVGVAPTIDASLLGVASELLSRIASGQVIEQAKDVTDAELSTDTEPVDNLPDPGQK